MKDRLHNKALDTLAMLKLLDITRKEDENAKGIEKTFREFREEINLDHFTIFKKGD